MNGAPARDARRLGDHEADLEYHPKDACGSSRFLVEDEATLSTGPDSSAERFAACEFVAIANFTLSDGSSAGSPVVPRHHFQTHRTARSRGPS